MKKIKIKHIYSDIYFMHALLYVFNVFIKYLLYLSYMFHKMPSPGDMKVNKVQ